MLFSWLLHRNSHENLSWPVLPGPFPYSAKKRVIHNNYFKMSPRSNSMLVQCSSLIPFLEKKTFTYLCKHIVCEGDLPAVCKLIKIKDANNYVVAFYRKSLTVHILFSFVYKSWLKELKDSTIGNRFIVNGLPWLPLFTRRGFEPHRSLNLIKPHLHIQFTCVDQCVSCHNSFSYLYDKKNIFIINWVANWPSKGWLTFRALALRQSECMSIPRRMFLVHARDRFLALTSISFFYWLIACPEGYYGFNCEDKCLCENNSTCNNEVGYCHCLTGFQGKFCEEGTSKY